MDERYFDALKLRLLAGRGIEAADRDGNRRVAVISKAMAQAAVEYKREQKPPSLFQLARRANSEDSRRGLSFMTLILSSLGKSLKG